MKTNFGRLWAVLLLAFALALTANANTIVVGAEDIALPGGDKDYNDLVFRLTGNLLVAGAGSWLPFVAPNKDGNPYFDNPSWDVGGENVGYMVAMPVQYWGMPGGGASNSFWFHTGDQVGATIMAERAAWSASNQLFWYNTNGNPNVLHLIFSGSDTTGATANFTPSENFGLVLSSPSGTFRTRGEGRNFALFQEAPSAVPEPSSYALMGAGLVVCGVIRQRRQFRR